MDIRIGNFEDEAVKALLTYHLQGMRDASPPGLSFALDWTGLQKPEITFWAGYEGQMLVAIGALKDLGDGTGEIKSMRVAKGFEGKGFGEKMLLHIIAEAHRRRYHRLSLETGDGAYFNAALKLYSKHGFKEGEAFADYKATPFNRMFHLDLIGTSQRQ